MCRDSKQFCGGMIMRYLKLDDFTKYKFLSGLKYSPNGEYAGFVVHRMDVEENKYLSNIWLYNSKTKEYKQLTSLDSEKSFIWIDDSNILFPASRNQKDKEKLEKGEEFTTYYKINIYGGEANECFKIPLTVTSIEKVDDNNYLVTGVYNHNKPDSNSIEEKKDYEVLDEIPFWSNGSGFTNKKRNRLYTFNKESGDLTPITDEWANVNSLRLNKNNTKAIIISNSYTDKMEKNSDLYLYDINENKLENLTHEEVFSYSFADFLGDKIIFAGSDMKDYGINQNSNFYILDLEAKAVEKVCDYDYSIWNSVGSDCRYGGNSTFKVDGDYLYFVSTEWNSSYIKRIDEKGNIEKITLKGGDRKSVV